MNLNPLDDNEEDPARLWAEIHTLREAIKGPDGYDTWQDAAVSERWKRIKFKPRVLRDGEVMMAYMEFDRTADSSWGNVEYLVNFGLYISKMTVEFNKESK